MIYLVVTIDVEPDCTPSWHYSSPLMFEGVKIGIKEILQPLFNKCEIIPTYLINNVVLEHDRSVEILKDLDGNFEFGTHLHPEFIEPDKKHQDYAGKKGEGNCCFYPPEIEFEKIKNITLLFERKLGYKPLSFRAGRFSAGVNTINSLNALGYLVDTSLTPHLCWDDKTREKPINYSKAPERAYFIKENSYLEEDANGTILEVPVSICPMPNNILREYLFSLAGVRRKIRKTEPVWLRPGRSSFEQMIKITDYFLKDKKADENIILNMMFHNVEVLPGLSPYTRTNEDCVKYLSDLEMFFEYCKTNSIISQSLKQIPKLIKNE
jgi:hypothetical protein